MGHHSSPHHFETNRCQAAGPSPHGPNALQKEEMTTTAMSPERMRVRSCIYVINCSLTTQALRKSMYKCRSDEHDYLHVYLYVIANAHGYMFPE